MQDLLTRSNFVFTDIINVIHKHERDGKSPPENLQITYNEQTTKQEKDNSHRHAPPIDNKTTELNEQEPQTIKPAAAVSAKGDSIQPTGSIEPQTTRKVSYLDYDATRPNYTTKNKAAEGLKTSEKTSTSLNSQNGPETHEQTSSRETPQGGPPPSTEPTKIEMSGFPEERLRQPTKSIENNTSVESSTRKHAALFSYVESRCGSPTIDSETDDLESYDKIDDKIDGEYVAPNPVIPQLATGGAIANFVKANENKQVSEWKWGATTTVNANNPPSSTIVQSRGRTKPEEDPILQAARQKVMDTCPQPKNVEAARVEKATQNPIPVFEGGYRNKKTARGAVGVYYGPESAVTIPNAPAVDAQALFTFRREALPKVGDSNVLMKPENGQGQWNPSAYIRPRNADHTQNYQSDHTQNYQFDRDEYAESLEEGQVDEGPYQQSSNYKSTRREGEFSRSTAEQCKQQSIDGYLQVHSSTSLSRNKKAQHTMSEEVGDRSNRSNEFTEEQHGITLMYDHKDMPDLGGSETPPFLRELHNELIKRPPKGPLGGQLPVAIRCPDCCRFHLGSECGPAPSPCVICGGDHWVRKCDAKSKQIAIVYRPGISCRECRLMHKRECPFVGACPVCLRVHTGLCNKPSGTCRYCGELHWENGCPRWQALDEELGFPAGAKGYKEGMPTTKYENSRGSAGGHIQQNRMPPGPSPTTSTERFYQPTYATAKSIRRHNYGSPPNWNADPPYRQANYQREGEFGFQRGRRPLTNRDDGGNWSHSNQMVKHRDWERSRSRGRGYGEPIRQRDNFRPGTTPGTVVRDNYRWQNENGRVDRVGLGEDRGKLRDRNSDRDVDFRREGERESTGIGEKKRTDVEKERDRQQRENEANEWLEDLKRVNDRERSLREKGRLSPVSVGWGDVDRAAKRRRYE